VCAAFLRNFGLKVIFCFVTFDMALRPEYHVNNVDITFETTIKIIHHQICKENYSMLPPDVRC